MVVAVISSTEMEIWCCAVFSVRDLSRGPSLQPPLTAVCLCLLVPREMVLQSSRQSLRGPDCKVPAAGQPLVQYGEKWQWHAAADRTCTHVRHTHFWELNECASLSNTAISCESVKAQ